MDRLHKQAGRHQGARDPRDVQRAEHARGRFRSSRVSKRASCRTNLHATLFDLDLTIDTEREHAIVPDLLDRALRTRDRPGDAGQLHASARALHRAAGAAPARPCGRQPRRPGPARGLEPDRHAYPRDSPSIACSRPAARRPARPSRRCRATRWTTRNSGRACAAWPACCARAACSGACLVGLCLRAHAGDGGGATRDPERRRRLCAAGPGLPAAAAARHGARRGADAAADRAGSRARRGRTSPLPRLLLDQAQAELLAQPATPLPADPVRDARPAGPGLCHLHLGLHRQAQGRGGAAPRGGELPAVDAARTRARPRTTCWSP